MAIHHDFEQAWDYTIKAKEKSFSIPLETAANGGSADSSSA